MIYRIIEAVNDLTPSDELLAPYCMALATAHIPRERLGIGRWCGRPTAVLGYAVRVTGRGSLHVIHPIPKR